MIGSLMNIYGKKDMTIKELTKLFSDNGIDYFIKSADGCVAAIHFIVKPDD